MRPNASESRDHFDRARFPGDPGLGLSSGVRVSPSEFFLAAGQLVGMAVLALIVTLALRLASYILDGTFYFALFTFLSFVIALWTYLSFPARIWRTLQAVGIFLSGPALWLLIRLADSAGRASSAFFLALPLGFLCLIVLADRIATHAIAMEAAAISGTDGRRAKLASFWNARLPWKRESHNELPTAFREYPRRALSIVAGFVFAYVVYLIAHNVQRQLFSGMLAVFALLLATFVASRFLARNCSISLSWRVLSSWFTHNRHDKALIGTPRSPAGGARARSLLSNSLVIIFVLCILPVAAYFPLVPQSIGIDAWVKAHSQGVFPALQEFIGDRNDKPASTPQLGRLRPQDLTQRERDLYDAEYSPEAKALLLDAFTHKHRANLGHSDSRLSGRRGTRAFMARTPESWLLLTFRGVTTGKPVFLWSLLVSMALSILVPLAFLFCVVHLLAGPALACAASLGEVPKQGVDRGQTQIPKQPSPIPADNTSLPGGGNPAWEGVVEHFQASGYEAEGIKLRDHLFAGTRYPYGDVVPLDRQILHEHCWVLGGTGTGKTHRFLSPSIAQLIRLNATLPKEERHAIFIFDLKGDAALRRGAEIEAENAGLRFKWFSVEPDTTSYVFNPLRQSFTKDLAINQLTSNTLKSLGLQYGAGYGTLHFSLVYQRVFGHLVEQHWGPEGPTFGSFKRAQELLDPDDRQLRKKVSQKDREQASDLFTLLDELARVPQLNITEDDSDPERAALARPGVAIDFYEALEENQVIYFHLPEGQGEVIQRIATFAAFTLLDAAGVYRRRHRGKSPRAYLFIDEFQNVAADHFAIFVTQAREFGLATIMANQALAQLKTQKETLVPIVQQNTRLKLFYSAADKETRQYVTEASGEALYDVAPSVTQDELDGDEPGQGPGPMRILSKGLVSWLGLEEEKTHQWLIDDLHGYTEEGLGVRKELGPGIRPNDLLDMNNAPDRGVFHVDRSSGFTQYRGRPIFIESPYHITAEEFARRKEAPWIERKGETMQIKTFYGAPEIPDPRMPHRETESKKDAHELSAWNRDLDERTKEQKPPKNERRPSS